MDTKAMFKLSYGMFVLTSADEEKDNGCLTHKVIQMTSEPNRIAAVVNKIFHTHDMIMKSGKFNASVISRRATFDLFKHFGFQSGKDVNKFADFTDCARAENGLLYLTEGTNAYFSAEVEQSVDLGSHTLYIARVTDVVALDDVPSCTYDYYLTHIKPHPRDLAKSRGRIVWRCKSCGYVNEEDALAADYICPLCNRLASNFEKVVI